GAVAPLHGSITLGGVALSTGWRFPEWRAVGKIVATAPIVLQFSRALLEGELVLEVCGEREHAPLPPAPLCHAMPGEDGRIVSFVGMTSGARYSGREMDCFALGAERALRIEVGPLSGFYSAVDAVEVDIDPGDGNATLTALDATNATVGQVQTDGRG